jgi:hypothetical protein
MTPNEAKKALKLRDWYDMTLADGTSVCRMDDEFKISPHGADRPDLDCYWLDREEVRAIAEGAAR